MSNSSSIVVSSSLPVESVDDVAAEWSADVYDPTADQPILVAIQLGQTAMLLAYQDAAAFAAAQSDPLFATDEYLDEIGSYELGVNRQKGELDELYRSRFYNQTTVSPEEIVAVANAVLAPYTLTSCVYFEHLDAWYVRGDCFDIKDATATSPIEIKVRHNLPPWLLTGSYVSISLVDGNTAANGIWPISIVMGPVVVWLYPGTPSAPAVTITGTPVASCYIAILITTSGGLGTAKFQWTDGVTVSPLELFVQSSVALGATGLTAHFTAGTYTAFGIFYLCKAEGFTLNGSTWSSSITTTTANFTQPASLANVTVTLAATASLAAGQVVYVAGGGYYSVSTITDGTHAVLTNLGYGPNSGPGSPIASGAAVGNGPYLGSGSVQPLVNGSVPTPWSSHVYGSTYASQNYPDRLYNLLPHRYSAGARAFSDAKGRIFWLLAPDISGIDLNVAALFNGYLDIVAVSSTAGAPVAVTTRFPLPPDVVTGAAVVIQGTTMTVALTGGATFGVTNGSTTVTATGSHFTTELVAGQAIFFSKDGLGLLGTYYVATTPVSDTSLTLESAYLGSTQTTARASKLGALLQASSQPVDGQYVVTVTGPNQFLLNGTLASSSYVYAGGGSVQTPNTLPLSDPEGFFAGKGITLTGQLIVAHGVTGTLDTAHPIAAVQTSTGYTNVLLISAPSPNQMVAVEDLDGDCNNTNNFILVSANSLTTLIEDPQKPGHFITLVVIYTARMFAIWYWDQVNTRYALIPPAQSFLWAISATAYDVYSALVASVNAVRGHGIRWVCWVDPKLIAPPAENIAADLSGLQWRLPYMGTVTATVCTCPGTNFSSVTLSGDPNRIYLVTLRFRGIIEEKSYTGGTPVAGTLCLVGGTPAADVYNVYSLQVSYPAQTYYLNNGTSFIQRCFGIDYQVVIPMQGGCIVSLLANSIDGQEITNNQDALGGNPYSVPGISSPAQPYNGQFLQMDVVSVT
jgi:hypothetical protein